jgi:hypothetical protein
MSCVEGVCIGRVYVEGVCVERVRVEDVLC